MYRKRTLCIHVMGELAIVDLAARFGFDMLWKDATGNHEMSSENKDESTLAAAQDVEVVGSKDWFLQSIIETVISQGVEIGVIVNTGGAIISGMLISGEKYFDELGNVMTAASEADGDIQAVLGQAWKGYKSIYQRPTDAEDEWQQPQAHFIHLKNARYYAPGQSPTPSSQGLLWRGKLSSVDGFTIGNFSAD